MITFYNHLFNLLRSLLSALCAWIMAILAPPFCAHCKKFLAARVVFCDACFSRIHPIASQSLAVTATKKITVFAVSSYREPLLSLVLAKSYGNIIAATQLGELMWQCTDLPSIDFDYLVPIPLHWGRYAKRGYNQAAESASVIAKYSKKPIAHLLKRTKKTSFQSYLSHDKRFDNVKDAFVLTKHASHAFKDKILLIVDDVMTSGATLQTAARQLYSLKPKAVIAIVACRVM